MVNRFLHKLIKNNKQFSTLWKIPNQAIVEYINSDFTNPDQIIQIEVIERAITRIKTLSDYGIRLHECAEIYKQMHIQEHHRCKNFVSHMYALDVEYKLYRLVGRVLFNKTIPDAAFSLMHPIRELLSKGDETLIEDDFQGNSPKIKLEKILLAIDCFEKCGDVYRRKEVFLEDARKITL